MVTIGFTGAEWSTTLASAAYTPVTTADWTVSYWVGADDTAWNTWVNKVQALGVTGNPFEATDTVKFSSYMLSLKMDGPAAEGDGVIMVSTGSSARGAVALVRAASGAIETHRLTAGWWTINSLSNNSYIAGLMKALVPVEKTGFWSFWCPATTSPYTCTAW